MGEDDRLVPGSTFRTEYGNVSVNKFPERAVEQGCLYSFMQAPPEEQYYLPYTRVFRACPALKGHREGKGGRCNAHMLYKKFGRIPKSFAEEFAAYQARANASGEGEKINCQVFKLNPSTRSG